MNKTLITTILSSVAMSSFAYAETYEVEVGSTYYEPQWLHVEPGDVINWTRVGGTHNVISGEVCGGPDGLITSPTLNSGNTSFSWTVPPTSDESIIEYYCSIGGHCTSGNQYGALIVGGNGVTHVVTTNGFAYEPPVLSVNPGDTVVWEHGGGFHTMTFGQDCSSDGTLDDELSSVNGAIVWRVPEELAGVTQPYFCVPHCGFGMTGTLEIGGGDDDCVGDVNSDSVINVDDLLVLLGQFGCSSAVEDCSADLNVDGIVSVDDLLVLLSAFGDDC